MQSLPTIKQTLFPAFLSLTKNKYRHKENYTAEKNFIERIDAAHLQEYCNYFRYKNPLPITYFYLLAQRAHLAIMVERKFPVPVVGMVHLQNTITVLSTPNLTKPFEIKTGVLGVAKDGSAPFEFTVVFSQDGVEVVKCLSLYLCKRKSKVPKEKTHKEQPTFDGMPNISAFSIASNKGLSYAKLSGDYNPIHTSSLLAKLFGFKNKIIHGWYTVSHSMDEIENKYNIQAKEITVSFHNPLFLPGKAVLHHAAPESNPINFAVSDTNNSLLYVTGQIVF